MRYQKMFFQAHFHYISRVPLNPCSDDTNEDTVTVTADLKPTTIGLGTWSIVVLQIKKDEVWISTFKVGII